MTRSAAALTALLVAVGRPGWWILALATFLIRGGFVLFGLSIVALPSPLALSNVVAPVIVPIAFGRVDAGLLVIAAAAAVLLFSWLVIGGWVAALLEVALLREAAVAAIEEGAEREDVAPSAGDMAVRGGAEDARPLAIAGDILGARLVVMLPVVAAIGFGSIRAITVAYGELLNPSDVSLSLPLRVAIGAAPELSLIAATWLICELLAGLSARRIAINGMGVRGAVRASIVAAVRRPLTEVVLWLVASAALGAGLVLLLAASRSTWDLLQRTLAASRGDGVAGAALVLAFVGVWLTALAITGVLSSVRTTIGVFEHVTAEGAAPFSAPRSAASGPGRPGTFGASAHRRPGDWSAGGEGGSL